MLTSPVIAFGARQDAPSTQAQRGAPLPPQQQNAALQVQLVISRYRGEKRLTSTPYTLSLKTSPGGGTSANLALGTRVPVPITTVQPAADGKPAPTARAFNYENVGINIDCGATLLDDGRFELRIRVNETTLVTDAQELKSTTGGDIPLFRSYSSTNTVFVKDGETAQFTAATDTVTGEIVRVEAKLTVTK
jgi:hypothetical protein